MGALDHIRVLELGRVFSGPLCGMVLADMGARVLKVERPVIGDESRRFGAQQAGGESCYFNSLNRNKKSIALDLKAADDRDLFVDLLRRADVLVHNWVQASLDKLGFSWEQVAQINPRLVYCAISGYGPDTSFAARPAQDVIAQALSGFMSLTGEPQGPPLKSAIPVVDYSTGLYAALAIVAALHQRQMTGRGQHLTVSLLETAVAMTSFASSAYLSTGAMAGRTGNRHPAICPYNLYQTRDGHVVIAVANDEMWRRCCLALGLAELAEDARFQSNGARLAHQDALEEILAARVRACTTSDLVAALEAARVSCARVNSLAEAFVCAPVAELGMALACGPENEVRFVGSPVHFAQNPAPPLTAPPALGADGEVVRRERDW